MFPRGLLWLACIFYCYCYAQEIKNITAPLNNTKAIMSDEGVISTVMVCTMFSVVFVMVPTVLYYRYCSKEEDEK